MFEFYGSPVRLPIKSRGTGTHEITKAVAREVTRSGLTTGVVSPRLCQHKSYSLGVMKNVAPTTRHNLETWLNRLVPENNPRFEHMLEGVNDRPIRIKRALTRTSGAVAPHDKTR